MSNIFDVCIIGMGVSGVFATYKLSKDHKNIKVLGIDLGRKWAKRRQQVVGWLGCLPSSDGKFYLSDLPKVSNIIGNRKSKSAYKYVVKTLSNVGDFNIIKDRHPSPAIEKKFNKIGYDVSLNDYIQIYPKEIHALSKHMANTIEINKNITFSFDQEVTKVCKQKNIFIITTEEGEYRCKKLIIAAGRSGWRWTAELFKYFGIIDDNNIAKYGIRIEMDAAYMAKPFNKSNCSIIRKDIEIGPLSWFGTVIPEDHIDMAISAYRSNEARWKSNKVSFNLIGNRDYPEHGFERTNRIGGLTFVITNDRIIKERVSHILTDKSKISVLPDDYNWLKEKLIELSTIIPEITTKAYYHAPTIIPLAPRIKIGSNLMTEVEGLFVVGESCGVPGILAAATSGIAVADFIGK